MRYAESKLNRHCVAWQDAGFIQVASDPVLVLARVGSRPDLVAKINSTRRLLVAATGAERRRTLIRGTQSISGDDLARSLGEALVTEVVIVRYGHKSLPSSMAKLFDLVVLRSPAEPAAVHYVDWGANFALPAAEACAMMFKARAGWHRPLPPPPGGQLQPRVLAATEVTIHPMFVPLGQRWMEGHGSLEIHLERPRSVTTWIDGIVVYPRTMHAIKALSAIKFGRLPGTVRGMQKRLAALVTLLAELRAWFGKAGAECGWRWEFRVASTGRPDPALVPGLLEGLRGIRELSDFLVERGALEEPGIEAVRVPPEQYFRPLQHAMDCVRERGVFAGRSSGKPTAVQQCVMADLQSMFGVYNPQLDRFYGRAENMWYPPPPPVPADEHHSAASTERDVEDHREPTLSSVAGQTASARLRRRMIPPGIAALAVSEPAKYACLQAIVEYGCLVPHPRAKPEHNVTSRGNRRGGLLPACATYIEAALVLYETIEKKWQDQNGEADPPVANPWWWRPYISSSSSSTTTRQSDLDALFDGFEAKKEAKERVEQRKRAEAEAEKQPDRLAGLRLFMMQADGIRLARRTDIEDGKVLAMAAPRQDPASTDGMEGLSDE